jgi:hypothetical protein
MYRLNVLFRFSVSTLSWTDQADPVHTQVKGHLPLSLSQGLLYEYSSWTKMLTVSLHMQSKFLILPFHTFKVQKYKYED